MNPIKLTAIETALYLAVYVRTNDRQAAAEVVCDLGRIKWQPYNGAVPLRGETIADHDAVMKARAEMVERMWLGICEANRLEAEALNL